MGVHSRRAALFDLSASHSLCDEAAQILPQVCTATQTLHFSGCTSVGRRGHATTAVLIVFDFAEQNIDARDMTVAFLLYEKALRERPAEVRGDALCVATTRLELGADGLHAA